MKEIIVSVESKWRQRGNESRKRKRRMLYSDNDMYILYE